MFLERFRKFQQGEWLTLLKDATEDCVKPAQRDLDEEAAAEKKREMAEAKVRLREVRRARVLLTSLGLAPGNAETLPELTDPNLRPTTLSEEIPGDLLNFQPGAKLKLDKFTVLDALRSAS